MQRIRPFISLVLALALMALVLGVASNGLGPLPALGPTFNPTTGVWSVAGGAHPPHSESLNVPGLQKPVAVTFNSQGTAFINAKTNHDLFLVIGYLQAKNRLFQMDLERRQGEGLLSQVIGPAALPSDRFELQLGILRSARTNWLLLPSASPARKALIAYAAGVNDVIRADEQHGTLPLMFKLLGYQPAPWTPIDSLVIQGDMTQSLDYTTAPIEYRLLTRSLGAATTRAWFPIQEPNPQHPYDLGPYHKLPLAPIESQAMVQNAFALTGGVPSGALMHSTGVNQIASAPRGYTGAVQTIALRDVSHLTQAWHHSFSDSNNWAVSAQKTANGNTMMAGDPHLTQTLPAIWYQIAAQSPGYHFSGVSIPGLPIIIIGYNQNIAWSLTNVQNQATFLYRETTSHVHPNQYRWNNRWRPMKLVHYSIPVKGQKNVNMTVRLTINGPIMTQSGQTLAVDWIGALPSNDLQALLDVTKARNFFAFKNALRLWHAPSQNFIYADRHKNIGLISAGYYAEVAHGKPWTVMSGNGSQNIVGTIPDQAVPQSYNPKSGLVFSANQREVTSAYPYYIGTALNFFSTGYRADTIYHSLSHATRLTPKQFAALQNDTQDYLATQVVPELLKALKSKPLSPEEAQAAILLSNWHENMSAKSPAASIWWTFINQYIQATFGPWWKASHVPVAQDSNLQLGSTSEVGTVLVEDLQKWTAQDPTNRAFTPPGSSPRTASTVMAEAFQKTVRHLSQILGNKPQNWQWDRIHFRHFASLAQVPALGYGPRGSSGDQWTVDAADGGLVSTAGPSWRMIVNWQGSTQAPLTEGVYPGGQSENPLSPWYANQINAWWTGRYYRMTSVSQAIHQKGDASWTLKP